MDRQTSRIDETNRASVECRLLLPPGAMSWGQCPRFRQRDSTSFTADAWEHNRKSGV